MLDLIVRRARFGTADGLRVGDIGIADKRIASIAPSLAADAPVIEAGGGLLVPGLVETHVHLDKTCILERVAISEGTVQEAIRETARAKRAFTADDVVARGRRTLEKSISHGVMLMRTHVEVDPTIGLQGFAGVRELARDYAWAIDLQLCVFPQEGLINNPGTDALLVQALREGAEVIGAAPYADSDPRGQIDRIFEIAREFDVDIDMHLDLAETTHDMQSEYVCRKTEEFGWGGRVTIGHMTQASLLAPDEFDSLARRLASAGVGVTILPATDLYLMGRAQTHARPRGVVPAAPLLAHGVDCTISTNNVLNPFTPYGDASLIRMANLYANVCHAAGEAALGDCMAMIPDRAARQLGVAPYGLSEGAPADLVLLDATDPAAAIAELAQPLWGLKAGRMTFRRERPVLLPP
ncbi:MAG TPA: amidohydrolase family protein [Mycobacterium sp.]